MTSVAFGVAEALNACNAFEPVLFTELVIHVYASLRLRADAPAWVLALTQFGSGVPLDTSTIAALAVMAKFTAKIAAKAAAANLRHRVVFRPPNLL